MAPRISVLIGRASQIDRERIFETLSALRRQQGAPEFEVLIADRCHDQVSEQLHEQFPEFRFISAPAHTPLPALRYLALAASAGELIVVTEDHCIAPPQWLHKINHEFGSQSTDVLAVAGPVENGVAERIFDRANFLCEYEAVSPPLSSGPRQALPGNNIAYRRSALSMIDEDVFKRAFWEHGVHQALATQGRLIATNAFTIKHTKRFGWRNFLTQRFLYSRHFAGHRFERSAWFRRLLACFLTPLLPLVLSARAIADAITRRRHLLNDLLVCFPALFICYLVWTLGEVVGYALGPGTALNRIE
ncbi:MAG: glycosyltransferase [Pseudomonadota bacterium]